MKNETTYQAVLGSWIAQKRKEKGMDQENLARRVGVSRATWSRIETGSSALNMDQLAKAASALDIPPNELLREVDEFVSDLREENVEVHDSRDQTRSASLLGAVGTSAIGAGPAMMIGGALVGAPVAFLGGAVLGRIMASLLAKREKKAD